MENKSEMYSRIYSIMWEVLKSPVDKTILNKKKNNKTPQIKDFTTMIRRTEPEKSVFIVKIFLMKTVIKFTNGKAH